MITQDKIPEWNYWKMRLWRINSDKSFTFEFDNGRLEMLYADELIKTTAGDYLIRKNNIWYYLFNKNKKDFYCVKEVRKTNNGGYFLTFDGAEKGRIYKYITSKGEFLEHEFLDDKFKSGYIPFLSVDDGCFHFMDEHESFSQEEKYMDALDYRNGFALVKTLDGLFHFRDKNGTLSEGYFKAYSYNRGFAIIQPSKDELEEFVDMLGDRSMRKTNRGDMIYKYLNDEISVFDLNQSMFADERIIKLIIEHERNLFEQAINYCETQEDLDKVAKMIKDIESYINDNFYSANFKEYNSPERVEQRKTQMLEDLKTKF